jgi:DNA-binding transcriptional ArsR family regulator
MSARKKAKGRRKPQPDEYAVTRAEQLKESISTRRHDIVDQIAATGPMSVRELAQVLGLAPSSLYYHVERLCEVGLLRETGVRREGTKPERIYDTPARRMTLYHALQDPKNARVMKEIVRSLCRQASKDFASSFDAPHRESEGRRRNVRFFRLVGRPDAAAREAINKHLDAINEIIVASAGNDEPRVSLMWVLAPLSGDDAA